MNDAEETIRDLTVVVPVHNEGVEFEEILEQYGREFDERGISYEFVFVLDGTSEAFFEELGRRRPKDRSVRLIQFNRAFGESIALAAGFKIARGRVILSLPSWIQNDPADVHHVLDAIDERGADVVTCWRRPRVDSLVHRAQSFFFNLVMRWLTRVRFHDLNCLQRAMRRRVFEDVSVQGDMYRFLPVLAHRAGYQVSEVGVRHLKEKNRPGIGLGVYLRRFLDISALLFLTRFTRKPLRFFGLAGGAVFVLGLVMCAFLLVQMMMSPEDPDLRLKNRSMLVLGVLLLVLGVQTFFIGLVAEIIIFTQGRNLKDYRVGRIAEGAPVSEPGATAGRAPDLSRETLEDDGSGGAPSQEEGSSRSRPRSADPPGSEQRTSA